MLLTGIGDARVAQQKVGQAGLWMAGWLTATLGMTVAGRQLAQEVSVFEVMLLRSVIATIILTPIVMLNGGLRGRLSQLKFHGIRNVVHYAGQYAWFSALLLIPLAEVIAIEFTMPLWIAILAAAFLGERLYGWKIAALIVGFGGVLMIVKPGLTLNAGHVIALAAAMLFAVSVTLTKFITRRDTALTVIFFMFTMQTVIGAVPAWLTWTWPPAHALPFDPLPSAFQRWLNARRDWPDNAHRVFDKLAECSDQTAAKSPYRMAVFTCLEGTLTIHRPGGSARTCAIQRVSYFPTNQRVRVWAGNCS